MFRLQAGDDCDPTFGIGVEGRIGVSDPLLYVYIAIYVGYPHVG